MKNTFHFLKPLSHQSVSHVTRTSDQIYLARDKFDRKLPCCKNNSTELFIVVTYLTKYMTCEKSDRISHTYISPKMFSVIKNLFTGVQAIEILMCDKLVWVKNSKSAKRILHLCPNVKNSVKFITPAWGIRSVRNTVQQGFLYDSFTVRSLDITFDAKMSIVNFWVKNSGFFFFFFFFLRILKFWFNFLSWKHSFRASL